MIKTFKNITLLMLLTITSIYSQQHDNVWTFGYTSAPCDSSDFGGTNLYFDDGEIRGEYQCRDIRFKNNCNTSVSDASGKLMLMYNGCTLNDRNNELVEGSEQLVRNDTNIEQTWWCDDGYNTPHGAMFLPDPYDEDRYYLFYRDIIQIDEQPYVLSDSFYVTSIDFEDGLPIVKEKNVIISDTVSIVGISAVRHANGRDWWIITKDRFDNVYHKIILDDKGIRLFSSQEIGNLEYAINGGNTTRFSPDGKYFAALYPFGDLNIFEFDRGSGEFRDYLTLPFWGDAQKNLVIDIEFSLSGDILYIAETDTLWQLDMTVSQDEFFATKEVVGIYDGFTAPFPTNFWLMQKAPDGKIYMSSRNGSQYLHIIHNPDGRGLDCDFRQHDYKLPTINARGMPYFPNFRLGPDSTWVATQDERILDLTVYPNPAQSTFTIRTDRDIDKVELYDITGSLVLTTNELEVSVDNLPSGIYFCKVYIKGRLITTEKIVVL